MKSFFPYFFIDSLLYIEGEYLADFGGEWVTGEVGNVVFELAWPLGLLQRSDDNKEWTQTIRMFGSSGNEIPQHVVTPLMEFFDDLTSSNHGGIDDLKTGSFGEYAEIK